MHAHGEGYGTYAHVCYTCVSNLSVFCMFETLEFMSGFRAMDLFATLYYLVSVDAVPCHEPGCIRGLRAAHSLNTRYTCSEV